MGRTKDWRLAYLIGFSQDSSSHLSTATTLTAREACEVVEALVNSGELIQFIKTAADLSISLDELQKHAEREGANDN